ncbi:type IV pilin protein [Bacillus coahuilensis]|uniref:type IV pilin protein n=1 Tax=Bacillus coahuilensis TaxID=408580 RepID=UPI0001851380|nr:prepilin-type N-terminal cleavage/methylation domain-containing protein [Bacillus coahuilensis]
MLRYLKNERGLTLIELLAAVAILGVLSAIAVVSYFGIKENTERDVCDANLLQLEKDYGRHLVLEELDHSDGLFGQFLVGYDEICPIGGVVSYVDGHVECSEHGESEEDDGGGVPIL